VTDKLLESHSGPEMQIVLLLGLGSFDLGLGLGLAISGLVNITVFN